MKICTLLAAALISCTASAQVSISATGGGGAGAYSSPINSQVATTGASASSGNTSGNNSVTVAGAVSQRPTVATANAPANFPTAPCMGSSSVGASGSLFGFSTGTTWEAAECMTLEMVRSFDQVGLHADALAVRCTSKYAAAAPSCIAMRKEQEAAAVARIIESK